jgi:hypothetical protein
MPLSQHLLEGASHGVTAFFYQLVLFVLIWLFIILHLLQSQRPVTVPEAPADPESMTPKRRRSNEPKAFEGLT